VSAPTAALSAAQDRFPQGTPVLHWPNGDRTQEPRVDVIGIKPFDGGNGVPTVRLMSRYQHVPVEHIERHRLAEQISLLGKVDMEELYFPAPPCSTCNVDTSHDGDHFVCPMCSAAWDSNGDFVSRPCVECGDREAEVEGDDGQPRCLLCETEVRANLIDATAPYRCKGCGQDVHGIGMQTGSGCWTAKKCGSCQHGAEQRDYWDGYMADLRARAGAKP
jgi:hypothetical protein